MRALRFGVLGPVVVYQDGTPRPVPGGMPRAVLARLLLRGLLATCSGRPVRTEPPARRAGPRKTVRPDGRVRPGREAVTSG